MVKESPCNVRDVGSIPGLGTYSGEGHSNPLQDSCLENPMDRGAWRATVTTERLSTAPPYTVSYGIQNFLI